jgi:hypothetical protein
MNQYDKLKELHELLSKGAISEDEFNSLKTELLNATEVTNHSKQATDLKMKLPNGVKWIIIILIAFVFFGVGAYQEYKWEWETKAAGYECPFDNPKRAITTGLTLALIAGGSALIGASIGKNFGPVGLLVGSLILGVAIPVSTLKIGEEVSAAVFGNRDAGCGSVVGGTKYDVSNIR